MKKYSLSSLIYLTGIEKRGIKLILNEGHSGYTNPEAIVKQYIGYPLVAVSIEFFYEKLILRESRLMDGKKIARVREHNDSLAHRLTNELFQNQESREAKRKEEGVK